jgi:cellulose synthase/poly-beta-1,6-N-acetylglucosamine synthase-like glycosyltransferase
MMRVSVIGTVKNEESSIGGLLDSLLAQSRPPNEVVLADGGSTDRTREIAASYVERGLPLRMLDAPGANISRGRNLAVAAATGDIIACADAGVRLGPDWLEELTGPFQDQEDGLAPDVVGGFFQADGRNVFEIALGAATLPCLEDVNPAAFLPSSRSVAFTRVAWERVGGYPEWLDYCEDLVFDLRLRAAGLRFAFAPGALAHFRPRPSLRSFFVQYFRYARGDGKADLWRKRHAIRYAAYLVALPALVALALAMHPLWWLALVAGGVAYLRTPYRRLLRRLGPYPLASRLYALALVPAIRLVGDVAKMLGYPVGLLWRFRHRDDPRLAWR